jgi:hypothetical protein
MYHWWDRNISDPLNPLVQIRPSAIYRILTLTQQNIIPRLYHSRMPKYALNILVEFRNAVKFIL